MHPLYFVLLAVTCRAVHEQEGRPELVELLVLFNHNVQSCHEFKRVFYDLR